MRINNGTIEVTICLSSGAYRRALEMFNEPDWDMRRRYGVEEDMTLEEFLALLLERKLR